MTRTLATLVSGGGFFEGPRWRDGRWWVSDFYRQTVSTVTPDGVQENVLEVDNQPSGLGWLPDGDLLVVSMKDHKVLRRNAGTGEVTVHADLTEFCGGHLNDMVVDSQGRAYVGDFGFDLMAFADPKPTSLVRVDPDGSSTVVAEGMYFPNGSVITPDGTTLVVGETMACRYTAFTIAEDGSLTDRRVWAQLAPTPALGGFAETLPLMTVGPDGCTLDAEGHIWSADEVGARLIRIAPSGEIVDEIKADEGVDFFACALGGEDGRSMLICAAPDFLEGNRREAMNATLLTTTVDVPHAGLP